MSDVAPKIFRFMDVPPELRDYVYRYYFNADTEGVMVIDTTDAHRPSFSPNILGVSKQIRKESNGVLDRIVCRLTLRPESLKENQRVEQSGFFARARNLDLRIFWPGPERTGREDRMRYYVRNTLKSFTRIKTLTLEIRSDPEVIEELITGKKLDTILEPLRFRVLGLIHGTRSEEFRVKYTGSGPLSDGTVQVPSADLERFWGPMCSWDPVYWYHAVHRTRHQ